MSESNLKSNLVQSDPISAGRIGGQRSSDAKRSAAQTNGKLGGRPRKYATASERQKAYIQRKKTTKS